MRIFGTLVSRVRDSVTRFQKTSASLGLGTLVVATAVFAIAAASSAQTPPPTPTPIPPPPDVAQPPADAIKSSSGLVSRVLVPGTGLSHPGPADIVTVNYSGWTTDGKMFDSSTLRGKPSTFPINRVFAGWREAVQLMVADEKRRVWIPERLAYEGQEGRPKGTVVFDIELVSFIPSPTQAPPDVKGIPADAIRTASGLAYRVLRPGTGTVNARATSTVTVHYSGWTTDGRLFDSSVMRGQPSSFALDNVIAGWTEGIPLMVEGEKTRFWIPENLAYKGEQPPLGMLVFDVELLKIQ